MTDTDRADNPTPECDESALWLAYVLIVLGMASIAVLLGLPR